MKAVPNLWIINVLKIGVPIAQVAEFPSFSQAHRQTQGTYRKSFAQQSLPIIMGQLHPLYTPLLLPTPQLISQIPRHLQMFNSNAISESGEIPGQGKKWEVWERRGESLFERSRVDSPTRKSCV